jgi:hypothetical protein
MNAERCQYCPECGKQVEEDISEHSKCINWGVWTKKYKNISDWVIACIENGRRVAEALNQN